MVVFVVFECVCNVQPLRKCLINGCSISISSQPVSHPFSLLSERETKNNLNIVEKPVQFHHSNLRNWFRTDVNATKSTFLRKLFANEKSQYTFWPENHLHYLIFVCAPNTNCYTRQKLHDP